jgi:hypothetical protein
MSHSIMHRDIIDAGAAAVLRDGVLENLAAASTTVESPTQPYGARSPMKKKKSLFSPKRWRSSSKQEETGTLLSDSDQPGALPDASPHLVASENAGLDWMQTRGACDGGGWVAEAQLLATMARHKWCRGEIQARAAAATLAALAPHMVIQPASVLCRLPILHLHHISTALFPLVSAAQGQQVGQGTLRGLPPPICRARSPPCLHANSILQHQDRRHAQPTQSRPAGQQQKLWQRSWRGSSRQQRTLLSAEGGPIQRQLKVMSQDCCHHHCHHRVVPSAAIAM